MDIKVIYFSFCIILFRCNFKLCWIWTRVGSNSTTINFHEYIFLDQAECFIVILEDAETGTAYFRKSE
jgi:hypothetical protein